MRYNTVVAGMLDVYIETGAKRVFAGAIEWPGWARAGRDEAAAIEAVVAYGPRYAAAVGDAGGTFSAVTTVGDLEVVERIPGSAGTDFGAPSHPPTADDRPLDPGALARHVAILRAAWTAFDAAAAAAVGAELRKGPRGGGRDLDRIVEHVLEADWAYLSSLGGTYKTSERDVARRMAGVRTAMIELLGDRARGEPLPPSRRTKPPWPPRYTVRRSAWHALDHAWEIEDRSTPDPTV